MSQSYPDSCLKTELLKTELQDLVCYHLGVLPEKVSPEIPFSALGANDLDRLELFIAIEKKFSIEIDTDASHTLLCVGDIARYLQDSIQNSKG